MDLHIFKLDDGATHWYAAESAGQAIAILRADLGEGDDYEVEAEQLPDDQPFDVRHTDEPGQPIETMSCHEWAKRAKRKGCVASTEY